MFLVWTGRRRAARLGQLPQSVGEAETGGQSHEHHPAERGGETGERETQSQETDQGSCHGQRTEVNRNMKKK